MKRALRTAAFASALFPVAGVQAAQPPAGEPTAAQIRAARTVTMAGDFTIRKQDGKPQPFFHMTLTLQRSPLRYRIDAMPLAGQAKDAAFYLFDGKSQYEYNSLSKHYTVTPAPQPGARPASGLYTMMGAVLVLDPDAPARKGIERAVTEEKADGRALRVVTDLEPVRTMPDGTKRVAGMRTWFDAVTGAPLKQAEVFGAPGGEMQINVSISFGQWQFDRPIPAATFVWKKPEGALTEEDDMLKPGTLAPDFSVPTPDGGAARLSDLRGKVVILDFWATWCGPCQKSLPHLQKVYEQVKDKGVAVLAVCVWDTREEYDKWLAGKKGVLTFPTAFDPAGRGPRSIASGPYRVKGIPTQYVIDRDGKIVTGIIGFSDNGSALDNALRKLHVELAPATPTSAAN